MRCLIILAFTALMTSIAFGYPNAIPLGIFFRNNTEQDARDGAFLGIFRHNSNNSRVLFILDHEFGMILHNPNDTVKTIKLTCQLLRKGFFIMFATGDFYSHPAYSSISNGLHIPFINWAMPRELGQFEISLYPPMEEAIADILISKGWTEYVYLYSDDEGPFRSIRIDQYVQEKGHRPNRIVLEQLPITKNETEWIDYFLTLKERTGRNRTIIDTHGWILQNVTAALKSIASNMTDLHVIFASYEVPESELQIFKEGFINVTLLSIFHSWNHVLRGFQNIWKNANASIFTGQKRPFSIKAALAYDSMQVAITVLNTILNENQDVFQNNFRREAFYNHGGDYKGIWCDVTKDMENPHRTGPDRFEHGTRIADRLRKVQMTGVTGHIEFNQTDGRRINYKIDINEVEFVSTIKSVTNEAWKHGTGLLTSQSKISYERTKPKTDQVKKKYIITTLIGAPFVMEKEDAEAKASNDSKEKYVGFCVELMKLLSQKIDNFDYEIRPRADKRYGSYNERNGTWDGMIGDLLEGRADMAVASLTITNLRETAVDFSKPFLTTGLSIMIRKPEPENIFVFSFMSPLSTEVWMYIIFAYLGISVVIFLVSRFSPYEWRIEETTQGTFTISNDFSVYNCLWFTLAAFMQQGIDILPKSLSGRIASSAWWFFTMIIVSSYTANLAAFLTLEKMNAPIDSAESLAKQTKIKYGVLFGGSSAQFFERSSVQLYKRMWDNMEAQVPSVFVGSYEEGIDRVRKSNGRYAFILEETSNDYTNNKKPCDTMKVGTPMNALGYGVATPPGSPLKSRINLAILELQEKGELTSLHTKWWVNELKGQCPQGVTETSNSLDQNKVAGIFYILIGGMVVSLIAAFIEFLYRSRLEAQKSQNSMRSSMKAQLAVTMKGEKGRRDMHSQPSDSE